MKHFNLIGSGELVEQSGHIVKHVQLMGGVLLLGGMSWRLFCRIGKSVMEKFRDDDDWWRYSFMQL